jgi:collectin sub-family member 12
MSAALQYSQMPHRMKHPILKVLLVLLSLLAPLAVAQTPANQRPPVGIPEKARWHNGRWYHIYFAKISWKKAQEKCVKMGGHLAVIPDAATQKFISELANGLQLWLGATDEKVHKHWVWVDSTPMNFKAWAAAQPDDTDGVEHYLETFDSKGRWNDGAQDDRFVVGYICEWKSR